MVFNAGLLLFIYLLAINVTAFLFYGLDKHRAVKHLWRIPEATLLIHAKARAMRICSHIHMATPAGQMPKGHLYMRLLVAVSALFLAC